MWEAFALKPNKSKKMPMQSTSRWLEVVLTIHIKSNYVYDIISVQPLPYPMHVFYTVVGKDGQIKTTILWSTLKTTPIAPSFPLPMVLRACLSHDITNYLRM